VRFFPLAVGALELGAGIVYAVNRQWALAVAWVAYAVAAVGLAYGGPR
jgi:hypothetical protein